MGNACARKVETPRGSSKAPAPTGTTPQYKALPQQHGAPPAEGHKECLCCLCKWCWRFMLVLAVCSVGGYFVAVKYLSDMAIDKFLTLHDKDVEEYCNNALTMGNITENLWYPGCGLVSSMAQFGTCEGDCIKMATMEAMDAFNKQNGGSLVSYNSRAGLDHNNQSLETVNLTGWWLPAPGHTATTPRIILQHGHTSNSNKHRQMFAAYQLRKLGFSVLVNNLRDHCYSDDTSNRLIRWGMSYPDDVLGAWDFAMNDPQNLFGGALPADKVGVMGFSMGAFLTTTVFGLEGRIPGVWVDSPPFTPKSGFAQGATKKMNEMHVGFLAKILIDPVWKNVEAAATKKGVDINYENPAKALPKGPDTQRKIAWVGNKDDPTVSFADGEKLATVLRAYPAKYNLTGMMENSGDCNGESHCEDHLRIPEVYEADLCTFWSDVFVMPGNTCGIGAVVPPVTAPILPAVAAAVTDSSAATAAPLVAADMAAATAAPLVVADAAATAAPLVVIPTAAQDATVVLPATAVVPDVTAAAAAGAPVATAAPVAAETATAAPVTAAAAPVAAETAAAAAVVSVAPTAAPIAAAATAAAMATTAPIV